MKSDIFEPQLHALCSALSRLRIAPQQSEYQLHQQIAAALRDGGFVVQHEVSLAPRCRIDFLVGSVGIEVKRGKPARSTLIAQCSRYLESDRLTGLLVVLDKSISLPSKINNKPVAVFSLNRLWGIALG